METTIRFERWFHVAALVELPSDDLLTTVQHNKIRGVVEAFIQNTKRVLDSGIAPISMVAWSLALQSLIDEACIEVWGDLESRAVSDPLYSKYKEAYERRRQQYLKDANDSTSKHGGRLWRSVGQIELFQGSEEISNGLNSILAAMLTGMWTAFEVLAGDLWEAAINVHPTGLAELKGKSPASMRTPKKAFTALGHDGGTKESSKMVKLNYLQAHSYDLSHLMGTVLRERFNFQILDSVRSAYIQAFDECHACVRDAILDPCLTVLAAARNVLIHSAGVVDEGFMNVYQGCEELRALFPEAGVKEPLQMTGQTVRNIIQPVLTESVKLIKAVNRVVGAS